MSCCRRTWLIYLTIISSISAQLTYALSYIDILLYFNVVFYIPDQYYYIFVKTLHIKKKKKTLFYINIVIKQRTYKYMYIWDNWPITLKKEYICALVFGCQLKTVHNPSNALMLKLSNEQKINYSSCYGLATTIFKYICKLFIAY